MTISVLWLGRTIPLPLNAGDRIYSAQLAGAVARQGARVVFLGLQNPDEQTGSLVELEPQVCWKLVPGTPNPRPLSLLSSLPMVGARFATRNYKKAVARELATNDYDAVVLDQYGMSWATAYVQKLARRRPILVHVSHDYETRVTAQIARNYSGDFLRKILLKENARKTRLAEERLARTSNLLVTLTEEDRAAFNNINPSLDCIVLPPGYAGKKQSSRTLDNTVPRRAIIVGSFSWIAKQLNLERLLEAADRILLQNQIELHVVGVVPEPLLSRLRLRFPWVAFRGFVDDLGEEFRKARIALVPEEIGGGFKLKILDYIFSRVPVAAVETALSGIPAKLTSQFIVEHGINQLLTTVASMIDDVDALSAMQDHAFEVAEGLFNWDVNGSRLVEELARVRAQRPVEQPLPVVAAPKPAIAMPPSAD
ncbi:glycosyltransferase [Bradyrhizobium sp. STM 3557]|uniref:glycosyltransferase n=1 Tax=Bradyrhizobium sp. STM 3557 TaxID=578920 RepID=UPI0038906207